MNAVLCNTREEFDAAANGAIFLWRFADREANPGGAAGHIMMKCPGCGSESGMLCYAPGQTKPASPSWELSGLPDKITLKPSINCVGCCGWHAYLTNGVFG